MHLARHRQPWPCHGPWDFIWKFTNKHGSENYQLSFEKTCLQYRVLTFNQITKRSKVINWVKWHWYIDTLGIVALGLLSCNGSTYTKINYCFHKQCFVVLCVYWSGLGNFKNCALEVTQMDQNKINIKWWRNCIFKRNNYVKVCQKKFMPTLRVPKVDLNLKVLRLKIANIY